MAYTLAGTTRRLGRLAVCNLEVVWVLCFLTSALVPRALHAAADFAMEDNEFAEFEEFDMEHADTSAQDPASRQGGLDSDTGGGGAPGDPGHGRHEQHVEHSLEDDDLDAVVEEEADDFNHLQDEEEFENFEVYGDGKSERRGDKDTGHASDSKPTLRFADVPAHLRNNWANYQVELLMLAGLAVYLCNYIYGKGRNQAIAQAWFDAHRDMLEDQFSLVGDDGVSTEPKPFTLIKETDSTFAIWCSGRAGCVGMLIQLKFIKRQDIVSVVMQLFRPKQDQVTIKVELEPDEMDSYVFALGQKKAVTRLAREMTDLSMFTVEKKLSDRLGLPESFVVYSEIGEATCALVDPRVTSIVAKNELLVEYLHFSDQFAGPRPQEGETCTRVVPMPCVMVGLVLPGKLSAGELDAAATVPLMQLVFYCVAKARRYRLSREGKNKAEKNRQQAAESMLKTTHAQRMEAAAQRREDKTRERKQRLLDEEDPEKQRRLERMEQKREAKRKAPRMKQLKVKQ